MNTNDYKAIKPGVYEDISFEDYCKIEAVNNSSMNDWGKSPLHASIVNTINPTQSLKIGRLVHCGKLEPQKLLENYVVMPSFERDEENVTKDNVKTVSKNTLYYKSKVKQFNEANTDKEIVTQEDLQVMQSCLASLHQSERAKQYLENGRYELTVIWIDPDTGLKCKARLDCFQQPNNRITDLKTTLELSEFGKSIGKYQYDRQAAFYMDGANEAGLEVLEFCFVAVENNAPFDCSSAPLEPNAIDEGRAKYQRCLANRVLAMQGHLNGIGDPMIWDMPDFYYSESENLNWES